MSLLSRMSAPAATHALADVVAALLSGPHFQALAANDLVPIRVLDLTQQTIPYWELRARSSVATGIDEPFLTAYREGSLHHLMIVADRAGR